MNRKKKKAWPFVVLAVVTLLALALAAVLLLGGDADSDWQEQYDLGRRYLEEGNYEEAILAFSAAIEIDPKRPEAYLGRGEAYMELGDYESAQEDFEKARRRASDDEDIEEKIEKLEERIEEKQQEEEQEQAAKSMKKLIRMKYEEEDYLTEEWSFSYNEAGLMTKAIWESTNFEGATSRYTTLFSYNEKGQLTKVDESNNQGQQFVELYVYNDDGLLIQKICQEVWEGSVYEYEEQYEYDEQGRLLRVTRDNGYVETTYTYDSAGLLVNEQTVTYYDDINGPILDADIDYYYDSDNLLVRTESLNGIEEDGEESLFVIEYNHDYKLLTLEETIFEENLGYREMMVTVNDYPIDNGYRYSFHVLKSDTFESEDGYLTKMTGQGYSYEFFYEDISEQPEEEPQQTVSRGSAEYEVQRVDDSYYDSEGVMRLEKYYDQIVLLGESSEYSAINTAIQTEREKFMAYVTDTEMEEFLPYMNDSCYLQTAVATVTQNSDSIFSFYITTAHYMGGVYNVDHYGQTYNLTTGEVLDLLAVFDMSEEELVQTMKDNAWAYLTENCYDALHEFAWDTLYEYQLEDFDYYIEDGQLILTFPTYILSYGAGGALTAPTGLYIS